MNTAAAVTEGTITAAHAAAIDAMPTMIWVAFAAAVYYLWIYFLSGTAGDRPSEELIVGGVVCVVTLAFFLLARRISGYKLGIVVNFIRNFSITSGRDLAAEIFCWIVLLIVYFLYADSPNLNFNYDKYVLIMLVLLSVRWLLACLANWWLARWS